MTSFSEEEAGYTRAYANAAKRGTAIIDDPDAGVKTDHVKRMDLSNDPSAGLRQRVAANLAGKLLLAASSSEEPKATMTCLDVGCSIGGDLALLKKALGDKDREKRFDFIGLDLLGAQLTKARELMPEGKFVEGNVTALPFKNEVVDSVQCSRLLVHVPDMAKAVDEMIRVLKPGGCGVFSEGNFHGHVIYTNDERLKNIEQTKNQHMISQCANPGAAMDAYKLLLARSDVENVKIEPFHMLSKDPTYGLGLDYFQPLLHTLLSKEMITEADMVYFINTLPTAQKTGNFLIADTMFEVSFSKVK